MTTNQEGSHVQGFAVGSLLLGSSCSYAHVVSNAASISTASDGSALSSSSPGTAIRNKKSVRCKYFLRGFCKQGNSCAYLHNLDMADHDGTVVSSDNSGNRTIVAPSTCDSANKPTEDDCCYPHNGEARPIADEEAANDENIEVPDEEDCNFMEEDLSTSGQLNRNVEREILGAESKVTIGIQEKPQARCSDPVQEWKEKIKEVVQLHVSHPIQWRRPITQLLPFLYVGSFDDASNVELLKELGVTHVLNCASRQCPEITAEFYLDSEYALPIQVHCFPAEDHRWYPLLEKHFEESYCFIEQVFKVYTGAGRGKVLVHCQGGFNRSVLICMAYITLHTGWPLLTAVEYVCNLRPGVFYNEGFHKQLAQFALDRLIPLSDVS